MTNLPKDFVNRMAAQLGDELPAFLRTYEEPYQRGIRLNPMKPVPVSTPSNSLPRSWGRMVVMG